MAGAVYHDGDRSSRSSYDQTIDENDVTLPGIPIHLLGVGGERDAATLSDGAFLFDGIDPGTYLLDVGMSYDYQCTSANHPHRVPAAVREGAIHIETIGDSIGVLGSDHPYPERLADLFAGIVDATFDNKAVGGSTTLDWLPHADTGYFDDRLEPILPDADVLTITLGGNDLAPYVEGMPPYDPMQILQNFLDHPEFLLGIIPNIVTIITRVQEINPDCDIVFVVYPNFGNSQYMADLLGSALQPLAAFAFSVGMSLARGVIGGMDGVVLADMYGALGDQDITQYLIDTVHPNDAGHQLYADVIFQALGGIVIDGEKMGERKLFGFYAPDLVPDDDTGDDTADDTSDDTASDDATDDDSVADDAADDDALDDSGDDSSADDTAGNSTAGSSSEEKNKGCGC